MWARLRVVATLLVAVTWLLGWGGGAAPAATFTWFGGDTSPSLDRNGTWDTAPADATWWNGSAYSTWSNADNDDAVFAYSGGTAVIGPLAAGTASPPTVHTMSFTLAASGFVLTGTNSITLAGSAPGVSVDLQGVATIDAPLAGSAGMTKSGGGLLVLTGSNVYTGGTTVSAGDLLLAASYALPGGIATTGGTSNLVLAGTGSDTPVIVLAAGDFTRGLGTSTAEVQFTGNGGFAAAGANRIVNLGGASAQVTWGASNFVPSGSVLVLGSPNADSMLDFRNPINLGAAPRTVQVNVGYAGASVDATLSGALTGAGGLIVAGDGTLALTSTNNAYTGGTTLAGASTLDFASGALPPTAAAIAFAGGILQWASGNTQDVSGRFAPIDAGQTANIDTNGNGVTFFNALSGPGGLTKIGGGTLTLAMSNTFTGTTTISGGTLALGNSQALAYSTLYYNNSGGTLSFGSLAAATLGGLAGSQNLPALPAGFVLTVGPNNQSTLYSGVLSGSGSLVKAGSGTLTLTAGNRYTGGTSVTGGTLVAQDAAAIPSGSLLEIGEGGSLVLGQTGSQYVEGFAQIAGSPLGSQATGTSGGALAPAAGDPQAGAPVKPAPEPGTLALLAAAAACGLAAAGRRRLQG